MNIFKPLSLAMLFASNIPATPMYYAFEGICTEIESSEGSTFSPGSKIEYVFLVDRDLPGAVVHHSEAFYLEDGPDHDIFYAEYIGGTTQAALSHSTSDIQFWGVEIRNPDGTYAVSLNGSEDEFEGFATGEFSRNRVQIHSNGSATSMHSWEAGMNGFSGINTYRLQLSGTRHNDPRVISDLSLARISDYNPQTIPEPNSLALLGLGVLCLGISKCVRKR